MQDTKISRKKKLMLPVLILPFACITFYAAGGGGSAKAAEEVKTSSLNNVLPSPQLEGSMLDKMSLYKKAEEDSVLGAQANGPSLFDTPEGTDEQDLPEGAVTNPFSSVTSAQSAAARNPDQQVAQLQQRLESIQQLIAEAEQAPPQSVRNDPLPATGTSQEELQLARLQEQMAAIHKETSGPAPEMGEMHNVLDKILDIQHPGRVTDRLKEVSKQQQGRVVPVSALPDQQHQDYFGGLKPSLDTSGNATMLPTGGFFGSGSGTGGDTLTDHTAIEAVIHETQEIVTGATIKMRLNQPVYVAGRLIPKGAFLFGICSLNGERLMVQVTSLRDGHLLFPVQLEVIDFDANAGIRIPGSITRDASKQAADQAIQSVALSTLNTSLEAQAASAGIETAKSLLSKKVRMVRVTVKAGYPILLRSKTLD